MALESPFVQILIFTDLSVAQSNCMKNFILFFFLSKVAEYQDTKLAEGQECHFSLLLECSFPRYLQNYFLTSFKLCLSATSLKKLTCPHFQIVPMIYPLTPLYFFLCSTNNYLTLFIHSFIGSLIHLFIICFSH